MPIRRRRARRARGGRRVGNCGIGRREYVAGEFLPALRRAFACALEEPFDLDLDSSGDNHAIRFAYPRAGGSSTGVGASPYINPVVLLEVGARSDHYPTTEQWIGPYVTECFPDEFAEPTCRVVAQAPVRTLLEKALILHSGIASGRLAVTSSRHAYDLAMMRRRGTTKSLSRQLFEDVASHKLAFADDKHAGRAPEEGIAMVPQGELLLALERDYRQMEEMFTREPPSFDEVLAELAAVEAAINGL